MVSARTRPGALSHGKSDVIGSLIFPKNRVSKFLYVYLASSANLKDKDLSFVSRSSSVFNIGDEDNPLANYFLSIFKFVFGPLRSPISACSKF